jgi:hypothetical protein
MYVTYGGAGSRSRSKWYHPNLQEEKKSVDRPRRVEDREIIKPLTSTLAERKKKRRETKTGICNPGVNARHRLGPKDRKMRDKGIERKVTPSAGRRGLEAPAAGKGIKGGCVMGRTTPKREGGRRGWGRTSEGCGSRTPRQTPVNFQIPGVKIGDGMK